VRQPRALHALTDKSAHQAWGTHPTTGVNRHNYRRMLHIERTGCSSADDDGHRQHQRWTWTFSHFFILALGRRFCPAVAAGSCMSPRNLRTVLCLSGLCLALAFQDYTGYVARICTVAIHTPVQRSFVAGLPVSDLAFLRGRCYRS
jgi:hypothetical protein